MLFSADERLRARFPVSGNLLDHTADPSEINVVPGGSDSIETLPTPLAAYVNSTVTWSRTETSIWNFVRARKRSCITCIQASPSRTVHQRDPSALARRCRHLATLTRCARERLNETIILHLDRLLPAALAAWRRCVSVVVPLRETNVFSAVRDDISSSVRSRTWRGISQRNDPFSALARLHPAYNSGRGDMLAGLTGNREAVAQRLKSGASFSSNDCSWVYIPGRDVTSGKVVVLYERISGVGGDGRRASGRAVGFADGSIEQVSDDQWPRFAAEQWLNPNGVSPDN